LYECWFIELLKVEASHLDAADTRLATDLEDVARMIAGAKRFERHRRHVYRTAATEIVT
jgi:hypothetical protein